DNFQDDPHANIVWNKSAPKFDDELIFSRSDETKKRKKKSNDPPSKISAPEHATKKGKKLVASLTKTSRMAQILTKRNKQKIPHNGFLYVFEKPSKDESKLYWRCEFQSSKGINCRGRIHPDLEHSVLFVKENHTCVENGPARVQSQLAVSNMKRRALETMEQLYTIYNG
uniref:FLYWCH-type domain-containing protein n=1 Tax=Meloidogyne javanica TaxID=6303 RepID=A0A915MIG4_MELJA